MKNQLKPLAVALSIAFSGVTFAADTVDPILQTVEQGGSNTNIGYGNSVIGFQNNLNGSTLGVVFGRQIDVAAGLQDVIQLGNMGGTQSTGTTGLGTSVYFGANADYSFAGGAGSGSYALRGTATGFMATVMPGATDAGAYGSYSVATEANTISFGSVGSERRLVNVASPILGTDAANKNYVDAGLAVVDAKATAAQTTANAALTAATVADGKATNSQVTASTAFTTATNADAKATAAQASATAAQTTANGAMSTANTAMTTATAADAKATSALVGVDELKGRVSGLESRINDVDRKVSGGVAVAMAMAAPVSISPGESALSIGAGAFGGQTGIAVAYAHSVKLDGLAKQETNELGEAIAPPPTPQPWIFKEAIFSAGVGTSSAGDVGARASVTFKW